MKSQPTRFLNTKYILVQSRTRLSPSDRQKLDHAGVKHLEYVSKNTYLCQYQDGDLEKIRQLEPVIYVDIYRTEFKIALSLKEANRDQVYEVDIVFHEGVDTKSEILRRNIVEKSHCDMKDVKFLPNTARLTIQGLYLNAVAPIDGVRHIEDVGKVVEYNDVACQILKCLTKERESKSSFTLRFGTVYGVGSRHTQLPRTATATVLTSVAPLLGAT